MLDKLCSKVKSLSVKYLKAYKVRVTDYIRIEKCGSSSSSDNDIMFSADHHGNVNVNNTLTTNSLVAKSVSTLAEQHYAPSSYTAVAGVAEGVGATPVVITLTTHDLLKIQHVILNGNENTANVNLTLPTASNLLVAATKLLERAPLVSSSAQKGDWFIFTVTNNSPLNYCALAPVTLVVPADNGVPPNGTITITGNANGLGSLCTGAAQFGLYFTNISLNAVAVTVLRLSGTVDDSP
jgi:hypothetical protein